MTTATSAPALSIAPAPAAQRGFGHLPCPLCGEQECVMRLDLDDLEHLTCGSCEESFTLDDVRAWVARWSRVLDWVDAAPARQE